MKHALQNGWRRGVNILALLLLLVTVFTGCSVGVGIGENDQGTQEQPVLQKNAEYISASDVALYLRHYGELPPNYMTKEEARAQGWQPSEGNLREVAGHMATIGGDRFQNREGRLPQKKGRLYYECDVNYGGGHRGPERLIYSNDGLIYYTDDHYRTFTDCTKEGP